MPIDVLESQGVSKKVRFRKGGGVLKRHTYQQSLRYAHGDLVLEIVCLPARLHVGGGALFLEPFRPPIEDLEARRRGGSHGIASTAGLDDSG